MTALTAAVAIGAAAGGFVQGLSGFAFGLVALGIWAWAVEPAIAGPLVVFGSLIGQLLSLSTVRRGIDMRRIWPFLAGGIIGVPIGVALLHRIDPTGFKFAVGVVLVLWCPTMLLIPRLPPLSGVGQWADGAAGWLGGVMGGLGGLTGPAPTLWCALRGWGRDAERAVFQSFNLVMQLLTMTVYIASGTITGETWQLFAIVAPAMLIPTLIGARLYRHFSDLGFRRFILVLLTLSGAVLISSAWLQWR